MPAYWPWYESNIPDHGQLVCIVCKNYPSSIGPKSKTTTRVIEIGEHREVFGVIVCGECKESMWSAARRGHARDDDEEITKEMWRQCNKDEYHDLVKQQLMSVLRMEKLYKQWACAPLGTNRDKWEDRPYHHGNAISSGMES